MQNDIVYRFNKVFKYIDENLHSSLQLNEISNIASFSPFHFHRIFKTVTGETLSEYVTRKRIEKAQYLLLQRTETSISDIAELCGFAANASFTRAFKRAAGISPMLYRNQFTGSISKVGKEESKMGKKSESDKNYLRIIEELKMFTMMNASIQLREMPDMQLAFVSCIGPGQLEVAFDKLIRWATPLGLINDNAVIMRIYHDSFKFTAADKVRMSACLLLNQPVKHSGGISITTIEKGRYICGSFEIGLHEFEKSWTSLYLWMNEKGYRKSDKNPFEILHNDYRTHHEKKSIVDFFIPIE